MRGAAMRGPCVRGKDCGHTRDTNLVNDQNLHGLCKKATALCQRLKKQKSGPHVEKPTLKSKLFFTRKIHSFGVYKTD